MREPPRLRAPMRRSVFASTRAQRLLALGALAAVVVALLVLALAGGGSTTYRLVFQDAGQLVKGDLVRIGGVPAGHVSDLSLTPDGQAQVTVALDDSYAPLRRGTTATIRSAGLATVASRYVDVSPAPSFRPPLPAGAVISGDNTKTIVDIDELFNALDRPTRRSLRGVIDGFATWYAGRETQANASAQYFPPALQAATKLFDEIGSDSATLNRFLANTGDALHALSARRADLVALVSNAHTTVHALGSDNQALSEALRNLPPALEQGSRAFAALRPALGDLRALVDASDPVSRRLAPFLARTRPVLAEAVPALHDFRLVFDQPGRGNDLLDALHDLPALAREAGRAFPQAEKTLGQATPVVGFIRPYTPDLVGWVRSFGAATATYDANGHYARTVPNFDAYKYVPDAAGGHLVEKTQAERGTSADVSTGNLRRCPGTSLPPLADRSTPFVDAGAYADCDPSEVVR